MSLASLAGGQRSSSAAATPYARSAAAGDALGGPLSASPPPASQPRPPSSGPLGGARDVTPQHARHASPSPASPYQGPPQAVDAATAFGFSPHHPGAAAAAAGGPLHFQRTRSQSAGSTPRVASGGGERLGPGEGFAAHGGGGGAEEEDEVAQASALYAAYANLACNILLIDQEAVQPTLARQASLGPFAGASLPSVRRDVDERMR